MGFFKNKKEKQQPAWKTAEPNSKPSLVDEFKGYFLELPPWVRKALFISGCIIAIAMIVLSLVYSVSRVYSTAPSAQTTSQSSDSSSLGIGDSGSSEASQYADYFYQMENWSFIRSSETLAQVENQIYEHLLTDEGFEQGSFVYALDQFETIDSGYIAYFYDTPREQYWKATITSQDWKVSLEKVNYSDTPQPPGADLLEEDEAENRGVPVTGDTPTATPDDAIMLNDSEALSAALPAQAAANINSIITGAPNAYNFTPLAEASWIDGSSILRDGENCTFMVQLQNAEGATLALNIAYNAQTNSFNAQSE